MKRLICLALSVLLLAGCAQEGASSDASSDASFDASSGASSGVGAASSAPEPVQSGTVFDVKTDWSRLEGKRPAARPDVDGGRWYPDYTDHLIPRADYGPLVPYQGASGYSVARWEDETGEVQEYWHDWPTVFYGLMTREGKIVVDPVYQSATAYSYRWQGEDLALPVLVLSRADPAWEDDFGGMRYAVAAGDGSWTTDFEFLNYTSRGDQLLLLSPQGLTRLDSATGARKDWAWVDLGIPEEDVPETLELIQWAFGLTWMDQGVLIGGDFESTQYQMFQPETGEVFWVEAEQWDEWQSEYYNARWGEAWQMNQEGDQVTLTLNGETYVIPDATPEHSPSIYQIQDNLVVLEYDGSSQLYRLPDWELLLEGTYIQFITDPVHPESLGCVAVEDSANYTVYDAGMNPILTLPRTGEDSWMWFQLRDGLLSCYDDGTWFGCWDLDAGQYIFCRTLYSGD